MWCVSCSIKSISNIYKTRHSLITGQSTLIFEVNFPHRCVQITCLVNLWMTACSCYSSPCCLSQLSLLTSIYTACCRGTNQEDTESGGGGRRWETYLPSTAATTLQLSSCSYSALSIRSRRSDLRTRLIINTWVHTNAEPHTRVGYCVWGFFCVRLCVCVYLIKAHLVRLFGRKRQEAGGLQWRIFHFQRKKRRNVTKRMSNVLK